MVINAIIYTFAHEDAETAAALLRELRDETRKEPGVLSYEVARSIQSPNVFVLFEQYEDQAAMETHLASETFNRLGVHGIRLPAKERLFHQCQPLD